MYISLFNYHMQSVALTTINVMQIARERTFEAARIYLTYPVTVRVVNLFK